MCKPLLGGGRDSLLSAQLLLFCYRPCIDTLPNSTENDDRIAKRMAALGISETDIEESFVRSGGHGGQNVNKTSTCVMLLHRPTGLQVKCQESRHQGANRQRARELLLDKLEARQRSRAQAERSRAEKLRRQKRGRSRAAKERILADKSKRAQKKQSRRSSFND